MRSEQGAAADMRRIARAGEKVLANCSSKPAEESFSLGGGSDIAHIFVTNARLVWMSANNDDVLSAPWRYVTSIRQGKKRLRHTLGFALRRPGWSSATDYPAEYVSGAVAKAVEQIRSGAVPVLELPLESTTAIRYASPHDDSPIGMLARMHGLPEFGLRCSTCGKTAGICTEQGDELFDACEGCERSFTGIVSG